jgi:hypothetical protein
MNNESVTISCCGITFEHLTEFKNHVCSNHLSERPDVQNLFPVSFNCPYEQCARSRRKTNTYKNWTSYSRHLNEVHKEWYQRLPGNRARTRNINEPSTSQINESSIFQGDFQEDAYQEDTFAGQHDLDSDEEEEQIEEDAERPYEDIIELAEEQEEEETEAESTNLYQLQDTSNWKREILVTLRELQESSAMSHKDFSTYGLGIFNLFNEIRNDQEKVEYAKRMLQSRYLFDKDTRNQFDIKKAKLVEIEKEVGGENKKFKFYFYSIRDTIMSLLQFDYFRQSIIDNESSKSL